LTTKSPRVHVPLEGFSTTVYYFITGEQITRRVDVAPLRDFAFKNGAITGPGAVEIFGRYSVLNIGNDVFTGGLADPNLWSNQAYAIDTGLNWYLNRYTKIYMDWQHAVFGNLVFNGPEHFIRKTNLLWLRFQLFF
jgi:phosphate-selective porin OprO/OprP